MPTNSWVADQPGAILNQIPYKYLLSEKQCQCWYFRNNHWSPSPTWSAPKRFPSWSGAALLLRECADAWRSRQLWSHAGSLQVHINLDTKILHRKMHMPTCTYTSKLTWWFSEGLQWLALHNSSIQFHPSTVPKWFFRKALSVQRSFGNWNMLGRW